MQILLILKKIWDNRILVGIVSLSLLFLSAYVYYLRASHKIELLSAENQKLEKIVEEQKVALQEIQKNYEQIIKLKDDLNESIVALKKDTDELRKKLYRENEGKKSLEELATRKTKLIENIINRGTKNVLGCFETLSVGGDCK